MSEHEGDTEALEEDLVVVLKVGLITIDCTTDL